MTKTARAKHKHLARHSSVASLPLSILFPFSLSDIESPFAAILLFRFMRHGIFNLSMNAMNES